MNDWIFVNDQWERESRPNASLQSDFNEITSVQSGQMSHENNLNCSS